MTGRPTNRTLQRQRVDGFGTELQRHIRRPTYVPGARSATTQAAYHLIIEALVAASNRHMQIGSIVPPVASESTSQSAQS
jgi:hypothetical protein